MLDAETRRRIDAARDTLVGKVPDPKSQVEQITIALIFKFMDDMDAEAEELGGKRQFFAGGFQQYGWARLMRPGAGGQDTLNLYAEAIARMPENPGIPPLFRDIFKNAFLPYRDPETLRGFLKIIDEFRYDHSERLGDAFEYLLSVLGSQGDAGQFRTPRHIIDFIVEIVDPKKNETILDPACGTAGFLISSYKHILRAGAGPDCRPSLTPDERARLAANLSGYDISPDMVRLSLVNMYLHGFAAPHIHEYDTLTSLERWNEHADVILANPPFMSPKGGIRPHNRFSVQSKRSEVLFVDYMAEHLTPRGRAGIIVPEGVIFQSGTVYKALRRMLVDEYLLAVVSLPAGVFNPYSGVKTSVLILDKARARRRDAVAFFKVENDGFGLGAQRRPIDRNDLPETARLARQWLDTGTLEDGGGGLLVPKARLAADGEYNLSGERYRQESISELSAWPRVALGAVCSFMTGGTPTSSIAEYYDNGTVPWLVSGDIHRGEIRGCQKRITEKGVANSNARRLPNNSVLIALNGQGKTRGTVALLRMEGATCNQSLVAITPSEPSCGTSEFLYWMLRSMYPQIRALTGDSERSGLNIPILKNIRIPLPPLDVQREIVAEIEGYQKVIDGARAVVDNYRPHIAVRPEWPLVALGEVCSVGGAITTEVDLSLPYIGADSIESGTGKLLKKETARSQGVDGPVYAFEGERLLYSKIRPYLNKLTTVNLCAYCSSDMYPLAVSPSRTNLAYLATFMLSDTFNERIRGYYERASIPKINRSQLFSTTIPLPPLDVQRRIVAEIEAEQALVDANRQLISRMERKIQAVLARVWGEEEGCPG